jgi:hypothetical protein
LPVVLLTAACDGENLPDLRPGTSDAPSATDAPETGPPETAPPETAPPETAPPATDAPETGPPATDAPDGSEEGDDGLNWLALVLVLGAFGFLAALFARAGRRRATPAPTVDPRAQMLSTAQWIHDQLSLELLALSPADAQQRWAAERDRFTQLMIDVRATAPGRRSPAAWEQLAQSVAALQSSLDTAVRVRGADQPDPDLVREAVTLANGRRAELQQAIVAVQQSM